MYKIKLFLENEYLGNSGMNYLIFIAAIILGLIFKGIISRYLSHTLYKVIGKKVKSDFQYSSDNNKVFLKGKELKRRLDQAF